MSVARPEVYEAVNFYRRLMEKIKKDEIDPFELSFYDLKEFVGDNILTNGLIISVLSRLVRLKAEYLHRHIVPEEEKEEEIRSVFRQAIKEETGMKEDEIEALLMFESIREKLRKPKTVNPERMSYREFREITRVQIKEVLHEDTDYNAYALEIAKQIEQRGFKIRSYKDFIGLMFAIYLYGIDVPDIKDFL